MNGDAVTVVLHADLQGTALLLNMDRNMLDGIGRGHTTNPRIARIDDELVKQLVESRVEWNLAVDHLARR